MGRMNDWDLTEWVLAIFALVIAWFIFLKPAVGRINQITGDGDVGGGASSKSTCTVIHTVRQGEYLSTIAVEYGTSWQTLASRNKLANPDYLRVGQRLCITE